MVKKELLLARQVAKYVHALARKNKMVYKLDIYFMDEKIALLSGITGSTKFK